MEDDVFTRTLNDAAGFDKHFNSVFNDDHREEFEPEYDPCANCTLNCFQVDCPHKD